MAPWSKVVWQEGNSTSPDDGYCCHVDIDVTDGPMEDPPFQYGKSARRLTIRRRSSTPALELLNSLVKSMKVGEISTFTISPNNFESMGIAHDSELALQIHLTHMERPVYDMSTDERLQYAKEEKAQGTQYFKDGNVELAFSKFSNAARLLISISEDTTDNAEFSSDVCQLRCLVHCNLALCQMKTKYYEGVVKNCDVALCLDPTCQKAWFRRGQANADLRNFEAAKKDFEKVCQLDPHNKIAHREAEKISEYLKQGDKLLGKALSKMFV